MLLPPSGPGWFLIDPNPESGFDSPLIDLAKLLQSLHVGYETVHRDPRASFSNSALSVSIHRSAQYEQLYAQLVDTITREHGHATLQQVYLHEMVNYLRLTPYQTRASRTAGLAFFGCLCVLLQDYERRYPGDLHDQGRARSAGPETAIST